MPQVPRAYLGEAESMPPNVGMAVKMYYVTLVIYNVVGVISRFSEMTKKRSPAYWAPSCLLPIKNSANISDKYLCIFHLLFVKFSVTTL